jgi:A/G-specific adenine glycosylase
MAAGRPGEAQAVRQPSLRPPRRPAPARHATRPTTSDHRGTTARHAEIRRSLLRWFDAHRRDLPWRRDRDPYRVWVAEVMLQQTRIEVVARAYERFLAAFPDLASLARAREERVLSHWSGLGYYTRARSLHRAARQLLADGRSTFPDDLATARRLPGVGRYTAAAVLSIAYGVPLAAVDGNVVRVLSRLDRLALPDGRGEPHATLAAALLARDRPGDWNQALMELGQTVCTAGTPRCGECPLRAHCGAFRGGAVTLHPPARPRRTIERHALTLAVVRDRVGSVALERGAFAHLPRMWLPILAGADDRSTSPGRSEGREPLALAGSFRHAIQHRLFDVEVRAVVVARSSLDRVLREHRGPTAERRIFSPREIQSIGRSSLLTKAIDLAELARSTRTTRSAKP